MRWVLVLGVCACGARTELDGAPARDAAVDAVDAGADIVVVPPVPCIAADYPAGKFGTFPFTVTSTHVFYMVNDSDLVRVPKDGGTPENVQTFAKYYPNGRVIVDETSIYWVDAFGRVVTASNAGSAPKVIGNVPFHIASAGAFTQNDGSLLVLFDPGAFGTFAKSGDENAVELAPAVAPTGPVVDAYADASRVYWITGEHVYGLGLAQPFTLTTYGGWPTGLAIDDANVWWTTTGDVITYANKDHPSPLSTLEGHAHGPIAVGKDAVFGAGQGGIVQVPKAGGAASIVVAGATPKQIVTDGTCVYYSTTSGKLARFPQ